MAACKSATENTVAAMLLLFTLPAPGDLLGICMPIVLIPLNDGGAFRVLAGGEAFLIVALSRGAADAHSHRSEN